MRSSLRSTTGTAEAEAEAASGRGPTRPLAPARAPWANAQGFRPSPFGDLDTWIWQGGRDPVVGRTATTRRVEPVYIRNQKWVSCSCRGSQRWVCVSRGAADMAMPQDLGRPKVLLFAVSVVDTVGRKCEHSI
jgi:hypothetical protein